MKQLAARLYLGNAAVLATHEIDSAYWQEWKMFHLPGGIQLFLVINLALLLVVVYGYARVTLWKPGAKVFSYFLAGSGVFAFVVHSAFLATGSQEFRLPLSVVLLVATLALSAAQIIITTKLPAPIGESAHGKNCA